MASSLRINSHPKHLINSLRKHNACPERLGFQLGLIAAFNPSSVGDLWRSQVYLADMVWFAEMLVSLSGVLIVTPAAKQKIELIRSLEPVVERGRKVDGCFTKEGRKLNDSAVRMVLEEIPDPVFIFSFGGMMPKEEEQACARRSTGRRTRATGTSSEPASIG